MAVSGDDRCAFEDTLELLGRKHALSILRLLAARDPRRFTDLQTSLRLNPKVLTDRLRDLVAAGILERTVYGEIPPRVEYGLTRKGADLVKVFDHIGRWHKKYA